MPRFTQASLTASARSAAIALSLLVVAACSSGEQRADTTASAGSAAPETSGAGAIGATAKTASDTLIGTQGSMRGMANMTGDPDHDFLRMMSDHHKGLILIVHMTQDRKGTGPAVRDARKLDATYDAELDKMMTMLEKNFKDPYAPKVMPMYRHMADDLKTRSGKDYDRAFLQDVIKHHEEAIQMIGDYAPKATKPAVKQMAEKMMVHETTEIEEMKRQLSALGS